MAQNDGLRIGDQCLLTEIYEFLRREQALIVHCSGTPKGVGLPGPQHIFPADLQHVVAGNANGGVACSVVKPGDRFHGEQRHSTGSVGLVLGLRGPESLVAVSPGDAGSAVDAHGNRRAHETDITVAELERSLSERQEHYNEWVVRDFSVMGIFVAEPPTVTQRFALEVPEEARWMLDGNETLGEVQISLSAISSALPKLPLYSFKGGELVRLEGGGWETASHGDIYPC